MIVTTKTDKKRIEGWVVDKDGSGESVPVCRFTAYHDGVEFNTVDEDGLISADDLREILQRIATLVPPNMIRTTFKYIMDNCDWDNVCEIMGWNTWMLNEGICSENESCILTLEQAYKIGLSKED